MLKRILPALLLAALSCAHENPADAQTPQYVFCVASTNTPCNTVTNPGDGQQGDDAWLAFGKTNLDIQALQPPAPQFGVVFANGSSYASLLPASTGSWCLDWPSLSAPPTLVTCTGGGGGGGFPALVMPGVFTVTGNNTANITATANGISGGIIYFCTATDMCSSGALSANQLVLGGGPGAAPAPLGSPGTATTLLHGNAAGPPSFGPVNLATDTSGVQPAPSGGTGVSNTGTITLGINNLAVSGGNVTLTAQGATNAQLPPPPASGPTLLGYLGCGPHNQVTGSYSVSPNDNGTCIPVLCSAACTITITDSSSFPVGFVTDVLVRCGATIGASILVNGGASSFLMPTGATPSVIAKCGEGTVRKTASGEYTWSGTNISRLIRNEATPLWEIDVDARSMS